MSQNNSNVGSRSVRFPTYEFLALFLPIAVLVLVVGFSYAELRLETRIQEIIDHDSHRLHRISGFIGAEVSGSLNHLLSLSIETTTKQALDSRDPRRLRALEASFLTLAQRNLQYQQIRLIDQAGMEKVRVMRDQAEPYVVASRNLQDKSQRYYFTEANALLPGELYISQVDLNVEQGIIENPPKPMLRIATPVIDSQRNRRGIIIINIAMRYLFNLVRSTGEAGVPINYFLLNQKGELLNSWVESFQAVEALEQDVDFPAAHPEIWQKISLVDSGNLETLGGLWTWKTLSPVDTFKRLTREFPEQSNVFKKLITDEFSLTLLAQRPVQSLVEMRQKSRFLISLGMLLGLTVYGFSLFLYLGGHVRARRAELNATYAIARASSMERLKELEERFRHLVEASSIGQLVVDDTGRIEISNPAAERMLGYEIGELEGLSVDRLVSSDMQQQHVRLREQYLEEPDARIMGEGRELMAVTKQGSKISVEVGLNPYSDQGRQLVLVSIIDLSARKGVPS